MEGLRLLKKMLEQGDYLCILDPKDVYFLVSLSKHSKKYVRFEQERSLYEFLCHCFGFGSVPKFFIKLIKVPTSTLCKLYMKIKINLNDTLIFRNLKNFGSNNLKQGHYDLPVTKSRICKNLKKSILQPKQSIEFLGIVIDNEYIMAASGENRVDFQKVSGYVFKA